MSLRARLVMTVFVAVTPAWLFMYLTELPWIGFIVGLLALAVAWFGGERFVLRQVKQLYEATRSLVAGDFSSRTGLEEIPGELGELARNFDRLAATLEERATASNDADGSLLNRALQQTVVAALGQFAMVSGDQKALLQQGVMLVAQTLEVEFCGILELLPDGSKARLVEGLGWREGCVGAAEVDAGSGSQVAFVLNSGEPVVTSDSLKDHRFEPGPLLEEHGARAGIGVTIYTRKSTFGVLEIYTARQREFTDAEAHFLFSVASVIGSAIEQHRTENELRKMAAFAELNPNPVMELNTKSEITYLNDAASKLALSLRRKHPREILPANIRGEIEACLKAGRSRQFQAAFEKRTLRWSLHPLVGTPAVHCYLEDITDRLSLEAQLLQSQKMESIGQLAAGVAHDFNNMLTIIQGHAGMLLAKPHLAREMYDSAQAVFFAAERAAGLTRQLLMFSRKNVIQVRPLDMRELVTNLTKMLKRLLGETVSLEFVAADHLPLVRADAGMIEQIIMNLAVNARDAILSNKQNGTLTISLSGLELTENDKLRHPEACAGRFVCLRVTDDGCGMDTVTLSRIFEPFFTTKDIGKGTGLGLATVYGIVKQHEGWIEVRSSVGVGTTFDIFLPARNAASPSEQDNHRTATLIRGGDETVLVVEDEPVLRDMAQMILEEFGYRVLTASSGPEALDIWRNHGSEVHLLITDMVMPQGMSGVELAERLLRQRPDLKIIFTSGYTMDDVSTAFLRKHNDARFIQKPYPRTTLATETRNALDGVKRESSPTPLLVEA